MKLKYNESDFEGVYRWENMPMDTLARIDKQTGDGFMVNKPLYRDMIDGLNESEKKKIKQTIFDILDGKTKLSNKIDKSWLDLMEEEIWISNFWNKIYDDSKVSLQVMIWKAKTWNTYNWLWKILIGNKKYFVKSIKEWSDTEILSNSHYINWKTEYKWLEYVDNYFRYDNDINIIKPVMAMDRWKQHLILYPFVEWLVNAQDLKYKIPKLEKELQQKYDSVFKKILSEWIVWDIKPANVFVDIFTKKIYIFDPVYNELWENLQSLEDKKIIFWLLGSTLIDNLRIKWHKDYNKYNWKTLAIDNFDNDMFTLFMKWIKKHKINIEKIIQNIENKLGKIKDMKIKVNFNLDEDFDPATWEIKIFTSKEEKQSAINNYKKQISLLQDFEKMINYKTK